MRGSVRGRLVAEGWGATMGFPALVLDARGEAVEVDLLESDDLAAHWPRLDAFEGDGYRRVVTDVTTPEGTVRPVSTCWPANGESATPLPKPGVAVARKPQRITKGVGMPSARLIQTDLDWRYSSMAARPLSRPMPLIL